MTVFLSVHDAISDHRALPLDLRSDTWCCICGLFFNSGGSRPVTCPRDLIWSRAWFGAHDRWWEQ